jgi:type III pantothenate kinase
MLLTFDVGNTLTDIGLFKDDELLSTFKIKSAVDKSLDEYQEIFNLYLARINLPLESVNGIIMSSVVPLLSRIWENIIETTFHKKPLVVGPGLHSGLHLKVDNPSEVGSDLVADAVGATTKYGKNLFIADLGTANKYLYLDKEGAFAGLAIAPGLGIGLEALVKKTASLPQIAFVAPKKVMGKNTVDCMNSGLVYGNVYQIQGFAKAFIKEAQSDLRLILTGGNAIYLKDLLPEFTYDESLLLDGLRFIYERNQ